MKWTTPATYMRDCFRLSVRSGFSGLRQHRAQSDVALPHGVPDPHAGPSTGPRAGPSTIAGADTDWRGQAGCDDRPESGALDQPAC
jgi:hypothetical protein